MTTIGVQSSPRGYPTGLQDNGFLGGKIAITDADVPALRPIIKRLFEAEPSIGLRLKMDKMTLKCYMADTGLLISHSFNENGLVSEAIYTKLLADKLEANTGMIVENIVAQMLRASGHKLYFYSNPSTDACDRMEIDFLIAKRDITSRHNISPIKVKSSTRYTLTSLNKCIAKYRNYLSTPYVIHPADLKVDNGIVFLPLYMTPLL